MSAVSKKILLPTPLELSAIVELRQLLELASQELQSGIFNEGLIQALLTGLKEHGPHLEKCYGYVVERTFGVFTAAMKMETFSLSHRIKLLELVMLRKTNFTDREALSLADAYKMLETTTRGTQTPHTHQTAVTEAATNTEEGPVGRLLTPCSRSINGMQQIAFDHYVKGSGFEIKVSGTSARLVGDVKGMIDNFFNNEEALNEALKANAHALKILKPPVDGASMNGAPEEKQEGVKANPSAFDKILDAFPQILREEILKSRSKELTSTASTALTAASTSADSLACSSSIHEGYPKNELAPSAVVERHIFASEPGCVVESTQVKPPTLAFDYTKL